MKPDLRKKVLKCTLAAGYLQISRALMAHIGGQLRNFQMLSQRAPFSLVIRYLCLLIRKYPTQECTSSRRYTLNKQPTESMQCAYILNTTQVIKGDAY